MPEIIIFSDIRGKLKCFESFEKKKDYTLTYCMLNEMRKILKAPSSDNVYVYDYASGSDTSALKDLKYILKKEGFPLLVVDRKNQIEDPAGIIFKGFDYISSGMYRSGYKPARLKQYLEFRAQDPEFVDKEPSPAPQGCSEPSYSGVDWKNIRSGREYTFFMLYTEIRITAEMKKKSGAEFLTRMIQVFQTTVERTVTDYGGRIWIWNDYGGLALFPYNGDTTAPVLAAVKLFINRFTLSIEEFGMHDAVSFRAAMHLGKTTYKSRGKTGTIISDSINSIYHLGAKYTEPDHFTITEEVYSVLTNRMAALFRKNGEFEDRRIYLFRDFKRPC